MNERIPKIYVNDIKKINNNKKVYYSYYDNDEYIEPSINKIDINKKINELFKAKDFIYKKEVHIKTKDYDKLFIIISKNNEYLLTLDGIRIYYEDIVDIRE